MRCGPEIVSNLTPPAYGFVYFNGSTLTVNYSSSTVIGGAPLVTGFTAGTLRNNFTGWVGLQLLVGSTPLTVNALGRIYVAGNTGSHTVELVNVATGAVVASVAVSPTGVAGQFTYATLSAPVTLAANTAYYLVSQETSGGDRWYDLGPVTATSGPVSIPSGVYGSGGSWAQAGSTNQSYVPVSLLYTTGTPVVTGFTPGTLRNNYAGWVGMQLTVGATPLTATALGRIYVAGNTGSHTVELVNAANSSVVASAAVSPAGIAGQFSYTPLSSPITLTPNTTYYLVSQESNGGDQWYDYGPVTATSAASIPSAEYGSGGSWAPYGSTNQSYGPVNLTYTLATVLESITISASPTGALVAIAVDGGSISPPQTFQWPAGSTHLLAAPATGNGTGTNYSFSSWSDGGAMSHTIVVPMSSYTYTANYGSQYALTLNVNPANAGTITPPSGYYASGQPITIKATPNNGYSFSNWTTSVSGSLGNSSNPTTTVTLSAPTTVTANFVVAPTLSITATAGSGQSTPINTAFGTALQATVKDSNNSPVSGATVTFTAPGWSASGTFAGGSLTATVTTNSSGVATAPTFTANGTTGSYTVTASVSGASTAASFTLTNSSGASGSWYNTGGTWTNRRKITIDHTKVSVAASSGTAWQYFPVLVSATYSDLAAISNGGKVGYSQGSDILFTASDGVSKLNHEIESYSASTGQLIAWVRVPSLSNSTDTVIYMYYGNQSAGDQSNRMGVWDSSYLGVWHLPNGSSLTANDSTSNGNNGAITGATAATGIIDGAANSVPGNYILASLPNMQKGTVSAWVKVNALPSNDSLVAGFAQSDGSGTYDKDLVVQSNGAARFYVYDGSGKYASTTSPISANAWAYLVGTADGSNAYIYLNGSQAGSVAAGNTYGGYSGPDTIIGGHTAIFGYLNQVVDEVRISNAVRPAEWILTEYNNQSTPTSFYTVAGMETPTGLITTITATAGSGQNTTINTAFGTALQATVKDSNNSPVSGAAVTFTAPGSGASGTFAGGPGPSRSPRTPRAWPLRRSRPTAPRAATRSSPAYRAPPPPPVSP